MVSAPDGAYQVGGGQWHYGQDLVGQAVDTMLIGSGAPDDGDGTHAVGPLRSQISRLPLSVLQLFKPFAWWKPQADFDTHDGAVDAIMGVFQPKGKLADRWQEWLDGVSENFGGKPGLTLKEVLALWKADNQKKRDDWQEWLDGIKSIFEPGASNTPVKDAIQVILGIRDSTLSAGDAAGRALMGVAAIRAEMAGGYSDEFDYQKNGTLPAADYTVFYFGNSGNNGSFGPNGEGYVAYDAKGIGVTDRGVLYRRDTKPIVKPTGSLITELGEPLNRRVHDAELLLCCQWSASDKSRIQARLKATFPTGILGGVRESTGTEVQFQTVNAAGVATNVGAAKTFAVTDKNAELELVWDATMVSLKYKGVAVHSVPYTPLTGQCVGFGVYVPAYNVLYGNPAPTLKGIAFHG